MNTGSLTSIIEALILASPEPLPAKRMAQVLEDATPAKVEQAVAELNHKYAESDASFRIREIAGGYQFHILSDYVGYVEELFTRRRKMRLTRAALETISIVAYRQPVTKTEIEHIRGVAAGGVIQTLLEKNMITIVGRASTVGKPLQYGTTDEFLKFFGLASLEALPKMSEIEELIAASQPRSQVELALPETAVEAGEVKLNIADGTFDPERVARMNDPLYGLGISESEAPAMRRDADESADHTTETAGADTDDLHSALAVDADATPHENI
jgi:segregation and condensation protein B